MKCKWDEFFAVISGGLALCGCHHQQAPTVEQQINTRALQHPIAQQTWTEAPLAAPSESAGPIKRGSLPLVYLVDSTQMIRIVDATSSQELLKLPVMAHTVIAVDARRGITVGGATMKMGPLELGDQYEIYAGSTQTRNTYRSGMIQPGIAAKPEPFPSTQNTPQDILRNNAQNTPENASENTGATR